MNYNYTEDQYPELQSEIRRIGFELAREDLLRSRKPNYAGRRLEHRKLLNKYYKLVKMN